ncbi:MAG: hypothetical protein ACRBG0_04870 [Lewinella sp.]|uniref:hypothetical protein n=1 Tax=Lewinella sp. TaxID=2004506 RepID=UPI003D6A3EB6
MLSKTFRNFGFCTIIPDLVMHNGKTILFLAFFLSWTLSASAASISTDPFPDLDQLLVGKWSSPAWNGKLVENWRAINATTFESQAIYLEKGDTLYASTSRIEKVGGKWMLFSVIKDGAPKIFQAISSSASHILFENPDYGNPREVRYSFTERNKFNRTITGEEDGQPSTYTFNFNLVPQVVAVVENQTPALRAAFAPLMGKTWRAEGFWANGDPFQQEVRFHWDLEKAAVIAQTDGIVDPISKAWGQRNHGIRYWNKSEEKLQFSEYDIFGSVTEGTIRLREGNIYYQYNYGGFLLTDAWEKVDEYTYSFKVGVFAKGEWQEVYLSTEFVDITSTEPAIMESDPSLPYRQIPDVPEKYNACTVAARMVDGLAFRYYWATESLRQQDLAYRTTPESRSSEETLDHIYGLANVVYNAVMEQPNISGSPREELTFTEKRTKTLNLLAAASERLKNSKPKDMKRFNIIFQRGENQTVFPFWNNLNGPIADALWHVGQVVAFRRASGNPFNSNVSVLRGTVKE